MCPCVVSAAIKGSTLRLKANPAAAPITAILFFIFIILPFASFFYASVADAGSGQRDSANSFRAHTSPRSRALNLARLKSRAVTVRSYRCLCGHSIRTLGDLVELLIRCFLLIERLLEQAHGLFLVHDLSPRAETAVSGDLVVLHFLGRADQHCVQPGGIFMI